MSYRATFDSIKQHPVPRWFHDGKLGIFIHILEKLLTGADSTVQLLGQTDPITWAQHENQIVMIVPDLKKSPAHTFKITPSSQPLD